MDAVVCEIRFNGKRSRDISWDDYNVTIAISPIDKMQLSDWIELFKKRVKIKLLSTS